MGDNENKELGYTQKDEEVTAIQWLATELKSVEG